MWYLMYFDWWNFHVRGIKKKNCIETEKVYKVDKVSAWREFTIYERMDREKKMSEWIV